MKEGVVIAQRPRGWYNERFELMSVIEKIPIFGQDHKSGKTSYRFTIGDSYPCPDNPVQLCGDGICCDYGNGGYDLYDGAVENGILLATGGKYELTEMTVIQPGKKASIS